VSLGDVTGASVSAAWEPLDVYDGKIAAVVIDPDVPATVYAGTYGGGVFRSDDYGAVWNSVSTGTSSLLYTNCMAIDPMDPAILYAGANNGVYRSANHGTTWMQKVTGLTNKTTNCLAVSPSSSLVVYAGTNGGLWRSENSGDTWVKVLSMKTYGSDNDESAMAIAVDPSDAETAYVGFWGFGVFRSENGGDTWTQVISGLTNLDVTSLAISPFAPTVLYVGTYYDSSAMPPPAAGVFRSDDGGTSWNRVSNGLTASMSVRCLTADSSTPGTLYAGTWYGVFRWDDSSASWSSMSTGLTATDVVSLAVDPSEPKRLYAGTWHGLFKMEQVPVLALASSWNLVSASAPLLLSEVPGFQQCFGYHDGWSALDTGAALQPGEGYWLQVDQSSSVDLTGVPAASPVVLSYLAGWQLLGNPFDVPLPMSSIANHGLITVCYSYGPAWGSVDLLTGSLEPGRGYWINLSVATTLTLTRP
jgi:photosystem II stability/assembly factor-like uncharacterized protein